MGRNDLVEGWAIRNQRKNVREAMQSHGEEVIVLRMYHASTDAKTRPRCHCWNETYRQASKFDCPDCFGTTFAGGVKQMLRVWALFGVTTDNEDKTKRGEYQPENRSVQLESGPDLMQNDKIIRVKKWSTDHRVLEVGHRYNVKPVTEESLRTGNQYAQTHDDRTGSRTEVNYLDPSHPIYKFDPGTDPIPQAEDEDPPWVEKPNWFAGEGPPTQWSTVGSRPGDKYIDLLTDETYTLGADNG